MMSATIQKHRWGTSPRGGFPASATSPPDALPASPHQHTPRTRWIVSQIGARQHYGVARGFLQTGNFNLLYTDLWCRHGAGLLSHAGPKLRAFAGRQHPSVPPSQVVSFNLRSMLSRLSGWRIGSSIETTYRNYLSDGVRFDRAVAHDLSRRPLDPALDVYFGFNTGCLQTLHQLNDRGIASICDQIDPAAVEQNIVQEEMLRWPGWEKATGKVPAQYWDRLQQEWAAASMILVNSRWSRDALIRQGVPPHKLFILPLAYDVEVAPPIDIHPNPAAPLTVLWLGTLTLRKGIQYLLQAAQLLQSQKRSIRFVVAGRSMLTPHAMASAPSNVHFTGKLTRDHTAQLYRQADLFVLPTLSDGFAITQLEAMAHGLPVITTPHCGDVVTSGGDGYIVPARDADSLAQAITRLDDDRLLLAEMRQRAIHKSRQFRLEPRAHRLEEAVLNYRAGRPLQSTEPPA